MKIKIEYVRNCQIIVMLLVCKSEERSDVTEETSLLSWTELQSQQQLTTGVDTVDTRVDSGVDKALGEFSELEIDVSVQRKETASDTELGEYTIQRKDLLKID